MKKLLTISVLAAACLATSAQADITQGPDHSFMWNRFNSIDVLDSFAIVTTDFGIGLLKLDDVAGYFDPVNQLLLNTQPLDAKVAGDLAIVTSSAGLAYFVDLSMLPEMSVLGEVDLGASVYDFAVADDHLYLACGFQGLRQYRLSDYTAPEFVDSSLAGVHCVQVDVRGQGLLVLDDYNGVLRYDLASQGLDEPTDILLVPRRAQSFFMAGDTLVMPLVGKAMLYRGLFDSSGGALIDSTSLITIPERVFVVDTLIVAINTESNLMEVISSVSGSHLLVNLHWSHRFKPNGDTHIRPDGPHLVLLSERYGLASYHLPTVWQDDEPRRVYARPGPISTLAFHKGKLATGGDANPLELFSIGANSRPTFDTALFGLNNVGSIADAGDMLFAHFPAIELISSLRFTGDSIQTLASIAAPNQAIRRISYHPYPLVDSVSLLLAIRPRNVDIYTVAEDGQITRRGVISPEEDILDAIVVDSFLLVTTVDRQLLVYKVFNNFSTVWWWGIDTPGRLGHMVVTGLREDPGGWWHRSLTLGFDGRDMYEIVLPDDDEPFCVPISTLPVDVTSSALGNRDLFTIGEQGVGRIDLTVETPQKMEEYGGFGGHLIAFADSTLATSDGTAIHLYPHVNTASAPLNDIVTHSTTEQYLLPNYPNPFNPRTQIDFYVPQDAMVEVSVFNLLGQKVVCLLEKELSAGLHSVEWDGLDRHGHQAASGVYFYRMTTPITSETRKMVLVK